MHQIQKHILKHLITSQSARYSILKPNNVEGNIFSYHIKKLISLGYIKQSNKLYKLTAKGRQFADRTSLDTIQERIQPKIVTLIVLKEKNGKDANRSDVNSENREYSKDINKTKSPSRYLFYKRNKVPFINHIGFPYGKIHLEERIDESANRELLEKTGLTSKLKHRGIVYITVHDETEFISHMLCHIFSGYSLGGSLKGECFWSDLKDIPRDKFIPGVTQIEKLLNEKTNKDKFFFKEFFLNCADEAN